MNNMSKSPTCDVCSKNLTNLPKISMTSCMDKIYHCSECQMIVCTECENNFRGEIFNSACEEDHCNYHSFDTNKWKPHTGKRNRHDFKSFTICQYCGKVLNEYELPYENEDDHIENVHHYIICIKCNIIMRDREEQTKHLYDNQDCLDCYFDEGHSSLLKMLMKNMQTLQKEINELKRHSKNEKSSRNFKTEQINRCDEKYLRGELYSKHNYDHEPYRL